MSISVCTSFLSSCTDVLICDRLGKRFVKNIVSNQKSAVKTYQERLKKLREDFLSDVIVSIDITVLHTHAEVVSISKRLEEHGLLKCCHYRRKLIPFVQSLPLGCENYLME